MTQMVTTANTTSKQCDVMTTQPTACNRQPYDVFETFIYQIHLFSSRRASVATAAESVAHTWAPLYSYAYKSTHARAIVGAAQGRDQKFISGGRLRLFLSSLFNSFPSFPFLPSLFPATKRRRGPSNPAKRFV